MYRQRTYLQLQILGMVGLCLLLFSGCSTERVLVRNVRNMIEKSDTLNRYQVGFALYDPVKEAYLYSKDLHNYYTPASNTKIYTMYATLRALPEKVAALRYIHRNDSLIFWGTGDPSFLQGKLKGKQAFDFLKNSGAELFYAPNRYTGSFYGAGWQWDDYNDYYQPEINDLPIMDNMVRVTNKNNHLQIEPKVFEPLFVRDSAKVGAFKAVRDFDRNIFKIPSGLPSTTFSQQIPYKISPEITVALLSDTLKKDVKLSNARMPLEAMRLQGMDRDSILKEMMLPSDNFIAEHLILLSADELGLEMNTSKTIAYFLENYLSDLPDKPIWVDGSGLSRYNLFTPADNVHVLKKLWKMYESEELLFEMFPAGGFSGTLKSTYPQTNKPFVFGKTGTVSNTHNQSGYIKTKKGRTLIYAFMNNNFVLPTTEIRKQMVKIVTFIHENY